MSNENNNSENNQTLHLGRNSKRKFLETDRFAHEDSLDDRRRTYEIFVGNKIDENQNVYTERINPVLEERAIGNYIIRIPVCIGTDLSVVEYTNESVTENFQNQYKIRIKRNEETLREQNYANSVFNFEPRTNNQFGIQEYPLSFHQEDFNIENGSDEEDDSFIQEYNETTFNDEVQTPWGNIGRQELQTNNVLLRRPILNQHVEEFDLGAMYKECRYCKALYFKGEKNVNGAYKSCCRFGKFKLEERTPYPLRLQELFSNPDFMTNIRSYNSALSFASLGGNLVEHSGRGPYCFKLHGQVYHSAYNMTPRVDGNYRYSQFYVIDGEEACNLRMGHGGNRNCDYNTMIYLDNLIRSVNPYAEAYFNMKEVEERARRNRTFVDGTTMVFNTNLAEQAQNDSRILDGINMVFNGNLDRSLRRFNMPCVNEIAIIFTDPDGAPPFERDLRVYCKRPNFDTINLSILSPHLDPMLYVLLFLYGEQGWQRDLSRRGYENDSLFKVTMLKYKVAQLAIRTGEFNPILLGGKLFQQWATDSYLQVEGNNLNFIRTHQVALKSAQYAGLSDYVLGINPNPVGIPVILPSTFPGSPRNMRQHYFDSMAIVGEKGKPDIFVTMTCNPNWKEIQDNLQPGQKASDRPDIVDRVFKLKLEELKNDIIKKEIFGKVDGHVETIEFQKRGLPHAHMLFILVDKLDTVQEVDNVVSAEIPDPNVNLDLHHLVLRHMIHGPCGINNPNAPCMSEGVCTKRFPKQFNEQTVIGSGYPDYKRSAWIEYNYDGKTYDNSYVVPYNAYLLKKFNCHINVEMCGSFASVKYLFKYVHKGFDCANLRLQNNNNEVDQYVNARYISAPEAMWRLLEFRMQEKSHSVFKLAVHLPRQQIVYFQEGNEEQAIQRQGDEQSHIYAWFRLNQNDLRARELHYTQLPLSYKYKAGQWIRRVRNRTNIIPRIYTVGPRDKERYYLRLLLLEVKGATSYEFLRTYEGIEYGTFEEAVRARGLIMANDYNVSVLEEAVRTQAPGSIRLLFALICICTNPSNAREMYERFFDAMSEDIAENKQDTLLTWLEEFFQQHNFTLESFELPLPEVRIRISLHRDEPIDVVRHQQNIENLNTEQRIAFDCIKQAFSGTGRFIFLDGPAGTGKTYLYNVLITEMKIQGLEFTTLATTGIAADLLEGGRTVHSGFKLPVPLDETSVSRLRIGSPEAEKLKDSALILIDEVSMLSKYALNCIDEVLRRICGNSEKFGGKTILLGGDFRQTPNVVPRGNRNDIVEQSIKCSRLWTGVFVIQLRENMRSSGSIEFARWLLGVGEGTLNNNFEQFVIPEENIVDNNLPQAIYGEGRIDPNDIELCNKIILASKNEHVTEINNAVIMMIEGEEKEYKSIDSIITDNAEDHDNYPIEFLHTLQPTGMPPHNLRIKVGAIVMLLRNIDQSRGLLNGTRMSVLSMHNTFIECKILTGKKKGSVVPIIKVDIAPSETNLPFKLSRFQFPLILAFGMTIHKSQGQTFSKVGLYLPEPLFTHGQLYVALSRVKSQLGLKIYIPPTNQEKVLNIVYRELLE